MWSLLHFLSVCSAVVGNLLWQDARSLGVGGQGFPGNNGDFVYSRWPPSAQPLLNPGEWSYGLHSSGLFVQFFSNATSIHVNYTLRNRYQYGTPFENFSPIGASGVDLYAYDSNSSSWRWVASSFDGLDASNGVVLESPLFANASGWPVPEAPKEASWDGVSNYRLHFPNYNGVLSMSIGVPEGASLIPDLSWNASSPVLYLGTSITQGGVTARPGQAYVSRLSMSLPRPVLNMGFCGSCRLEKGLAQALLAMPRVPSVLVIACTENMSPSSVSANTADFVRTIRAGWGKELSIVLVEPIDDTPSWVCPTCSNFYARPALREALWGSFQELVNGGDTHLSYVNGSTLRAGADDEIEEWTYEGVHPLSRGHSKIALAMKAVLEPLVEGAPRDWKAAAPKAGELEETTAPPPSPPLSSASAFLYKEGVHSLASAPPPSTLLWKDAASLLYIGGRAFPPEALPGPYSRLPLSAHGVVREEVWGLGLNSAGIYVGFESDGGEIWVNYTVADPMVPMPHFPVTGISGADLWAWDDSRGVYRFVAPSSPSFGAKSLLQLFTYPGINVTSPGVRRQWLLFLATYNTVLSCSVGVPGGSYLGPHTPWPTHVTSAGTPPQGPHTRWSQAAVPLPPIVWYGTSILQGGVSTKVSHMETTRVAVAMNREIYNFGFSGNCKMEENVAEFLLTIPSLSLSSSPFIIDCFWNMGGESLNSSAIDLVRYLRSKGLTAPVVLAEGLPFGRNWAVPQSALEQASSNAYLLNAFNTLKEAGDDRLYYLNTSQLFGAEAVRDSGTAAGLHATDDGMHDLSSAFISLLKNIL